MRIDVAGAVAADGDVSQFDPSSSSRSAIQGPFRSCTRPVRTSVPVTTIPARALTGMSLRTGDRGVESASVPTGYQLGDNVANPLPEAAGRAGAGRSDDRSAAAIRAGETAAATGAPETAEAGRERRVDASHMRCGGRQEVRCSDQVRHRGAPAWPLDDPKN
ncbi:hypothetical protein BZL30_4845 [Mycobacterium kansasii]|uniref:Uncharacterized protein n=1 Tax=Mycobacterium kansasii TaxID=1768 RepID=A0A1V3X3S8_MYCKA|nr:hypothetical protein BZL30_4845 [Mycobacterium kansasii]